MYIIIVMRLQLNEEKLSWELEKWLGSQEHWVFQRAYAWFPVPL